jgi:hypothetical protein
LPQTIEPSFLSGNSTGSARWLYRAQRPGRFFVKNLGENQNHAMAFPMTGSKFARLRDGRAPEEKREFFYFSAVTY